MEGVVDVYMPDLKVLTRERARGYLKRPDYPEVARETIKQVGYTRAKYGFDYETCGVIAAIDEQSSDIAMGVDNLGALRGQAPAGLGHDSVAEQQVGRLTVDYPNTLDEVRIHLTPPSIR